MQYVTTTRIIGAPGAASAQPIEAGVRVTVEDLRRAGYSYAEHAWAVCLQQGDIVPLKSAGSGAAPGPASPAIGDKGAPTEDFGDQVVALLRQRPAGTELVRP